MTTTETTPTTKRPQPAVTDTNGKTWKLVFIVPMIKPLTEALGHHPRELLTSPEKLVGFLTDPERVAKAAYTLTEPVPPAIPKATAEEFAAALDSAALDQCAEAVIRLTAGMFAPRGKKEQVADALIDLLKAAGATAAEPKAEQPEPEQSAAA